MSNAIDLENKFGAQNYAPLPVVLVKGEGIYLWDETGTKYIDMMSAYSAVSLGHCNPEITKCLVDQANTLNVTSRAFYTDKLSLFLQKACELTHQEKALPMNTGAEAVETAIKAARKWGYKAKGISENKAEIITCENNFHGRTISVISFSTEEQYKADFGPLTPGFVTIPYGDSDALENAINENTAAFLVEPIQGEAGIIIPPAGYLKRCADICKKHNVLLICDEIQTGLGRTGKFLACEHEDVHPDGLILGKALGGGVLAASLFLSNNKVLGLFKPGDHGSTFGGNPLASAVATKALTLIHEQKLSEKSAELGDYFMQELSKIDNPIITDVRGKGLFIGMEIDPDKYSAREICLKLMENGLLSKETHHTVVRFAPPLTITKEEIDAAMDIIRTSLDAL